MFIHTIIKKRSAGVRKERVIKRQQAVKYLLHFEESAPVCFVAFEINRASHIVPFFSDRPLIRCNLGVVVNACIRHSTSSLGSAVSAAQLLVYTVVLFVVYCCIVKLGTYSVGSVAASSRQAIRVCPQMCPFPRRLR